MVEQDPLKAILQVHAELAAHSVLKAPRHPAVGAGRLAPEDVLRALVLILIRDGVKPANIREAVNGAIEDANK
jgi:hypothetical protein